MANDTPSRSHPAAQALLAGLMQGIGEREGDEALADAGRWLGDAAMDEHERRERWKDSQARWGWPAGRTPHRRGLRLVPKDEGDKS